MGKCIGGKNHKYLSVPDILGTAPLENGWDIKWCKHCGSLFEFYKGKKQRWSHDSEHHGEDGKFPTYYGKIPLEEYK